jgi:hypothetical protein
MSGALQAIFQNQRSFGEPTPTVIGQAYGGGYYAGQIGVAGVATHYLVVAPLSSGQITNRWKNANTATPGADSDIDGPQNTADMVADGNSTVYPAAHFCNDLSVGSQTDWYFPAKNELEVCYYNLKPGTQSNNTSSGVNPNAVPARVLPYTSGTPAQTSAAIFQTGGSEAFVAGGYWCSTEFSASDANSNYLNNGYQAHFSKNYANNRIRAIRRVAV